MEWPSIDLIYKYGGRLGGTGPISYSIMHAHAHNACRNGPRWKKLRSALGKQSIPRNALTYAPGFNEIFQHFTEYIRNNRGPDDDVMADITRPTKLLFFESENQLCIVL